ncbi:MAG: hypothetical protein HON76_05270 [Candidatus Scalindua sp.]|jgi:hypothetical protein|nr:hypothetical protein [Candidatus Scalindua sp.]MBT5304022.1 hypothetical protein [Candidatus Scalindua sp.]MBT6228024.1 hypothetical protein [Candidatus Scalindua sp.]MBT6561920.1 hypothetical protein [Candidatus Scalindua sp.]MBT7211156.1 hypothetical protein [Candidatus Scalindua sp.]
MNKRKDSFDNSDNSTPLNPTDRDELLKSFDEKRRSFLKKLLISAAYVTPAILSFSIGNVEARAKKLPTRKNKKRSR